MTRAAEVTLVLKSRAVCLVLATYTALGLLSLHATERLVKIGLLVRGIKLELETLVVLPKNLRRRVLVPIQRQPHVVLVAHELLSLHRHDRLQDFHYSTEHRQELDESHAGFRESARRQTSFAWSVYCSNLPAAASVTVNIIASVASNMAKDPPGTPCDTRSRCPKSALLTVSLAACHGISSGESCSLHPSSRFAISARSRTLLRSRFAVPSSAIPISNSNKRIRKLNY